MTMKRKQLTTYGVQQKQFLRDKFIAIHIYLKKQEKHRMDNLTAPKTTGTRTIKIKQNKQTKIVEGKIHIHPSINKKKQ